MEQAVQQPQRQHPGRSCSPLPLGLRTRESPSISGPALRSEAREAADVQGEVMLAEAVRDGVLALAPQPRSQVQVCLKSRGSRKSAARGSDLETRSTFVSQGHSCALTHYSPLFFFSFGCLLVLPDQVGEGERDCCGRLAVLGDADVRPELLRLGQANVRLREQLSVKDGLRHALQVSLHT